MVRSLLTQLIDADLHGSSIGINVSLVASMRFKEKRFSIISAFSKHIFSTNSDRRRVTQVNGINPSIIYGTLFNDF